MTIMTCSNVFFLFSRSVNRKTASRC